MRVLGRDEYKPHNLSPLPNGERVRVRGGYKITQRNMRKDMPLNYLIRFIGGRSVCPLLLG